MHLRFTSENDSWQGQQVGELYQTIRKGIGEYYFKAGSCEDEVVATLCALSLMVGLGESFHVDIVTEDKHLEKGCVVLVVKWFENHQERFEHLIFGPIKQCINIVSETHGDIRFSMDIAVGLKEEASDKYNVMGLGHLKTPPKSLKEMVGAIVAGFEGSGENGGISSGSIEDMVEEIVNAIEHIK